MKRLITMIALWATIFFCSNAAPNIAISGCVPSEGAEISTFEFDLEFDLSEVYAEYGYSEDFGIGIGSNSKYGFKLYRGKDDSGDLLQTLYNYNVNGTHDEFKTGNKIHLKFNDDYILNGETYALVINTSLTCRKKGETTSYSANLRYDKSPLIYTFVAKTNTENFALKDWSIESNVEIDNLNIINLEFTKPIYICENAYVNLYILLPYEVGNGFSEILFNKIPISLSDEIESQILTLDFGKVRTYAGWKYKIEIPDGTISEKGNINNCLPQISRTLIGNLQEYFTAESIEPIVDEHGIVKSVAITWNTPEALQNNVEDSALYAWLLGLCDENGDSVGFFKPTTESEWPILKYDFVGSLEPGKTYHFKKNAGVLHGYLEGLGLCQGLLNEAFDLQFVAPEISSNIDLPNIEYNYLGIFNTESYNELTKLDDFYPTHKIETVEAEVFDYIYNGTKYEVHPKTDVKGQFYETTSDGDILLKEFQMSRERRGNNGLYLKKTVVCPINLDLIKGKTYKLVIPENALYVKSSSGGDNTIGKYVKSPRFEFNFVGADDSVSVDEISDREIKVTSQDNRIFIEGLSEFSNVKIFTPDGMMIADFVVSDSSTSLEVSNGIYIVIVDGKSTKVIVR